MNRSSSTTSSFKSIVRYIALAIVSMVIGLLALDWFWTRTVVMHYDWSGSSQLKRLFEHNDPFEIPVFGASYAQRSYLADTLGPNFYAYGRSGSSFQKLYPLLEAEFAKERETPVIIDFYENFLRHREDYTLEVRDFVPMAREPGVEEVMRDFEVFSWHYKVPGIRYFGQYFEYWSDDQKNKREVNRNYFCRGGAFFKPHTPKAKFADYVAKRRETYSTFEVTPSLEARFEKMLASRPDRRVVLVVSPHHWSAYEHSIDLPAMRIYLTTLAARYANVDLIVVDGSDYPDDCFKDSIHLNIRGARKFSSELRKQLNKLGISG